MDAKKSPLERDAALAFARGFQQIIAIRGRSVVELDLRRAPPDDAALTAAIIGPTGRLRAPSFRIGRTLVVGFDPGVLGRLLSR